MDADEFRTLWQARGNHLPQDLDRALTDAAPLIQAVSRREMNRLIYSQAPDVDSSGKPKWVQTRKLYHGELAEAEPTRRRVILVNRVVYARARHELGRDGRKTRRIAHWRDSARETMRTAFREQIRSGILASLGGGLVSPSS